MSRETFCPDCKKLVGLMTPPLTPKTRSGPRKRVKHGDPNLPRINGRMQECAGSRIEVPDVAVYEVTHDARTRRQLNKAEAPA